MDELQRFLITFASVGLAGIALHRAFGVRADPFIGLAVVQLIWVTWASHRARRAEIRRTLAELRAYAARDREQIVAHIESPRLRSALSRELARDGSETTDGTTETFPFPARFRRRATIRYWRDWLISATALAIASFTPSLAPTWRVIWLAIGVGFLWRARRYTRWFHAVSSVIEVNPFRIALVWPDGRRETISFADGAICEDVPEDRLFVVRSGATVIPVSYHLVGFNRITTLVEAYGASVPTANAPAS